MSAPHVSVIIPTYNRGRFLGRAIESALAQTEPRVEVLVVDDGSPGDGQERIVKGYGDARLFYFRVPERRGPAAARNVALRHARARYVAFLDDDDEWLPGKLARQLEVLDAAPPVVGGACTARFTVNSVTGTVTETRCTPARFDGPLHLNPITTSSLLVRRECFESAGEFDEQLEAGSDYDMWLRISLAYRFQYIDEPLVRYFVHGDQISTDYHKKARSSARILEKHADVFARDPKAFSRSQIAVGALWCYSGDLRRARRAYWNAIRLDPRSGRAYRDLALSLLGSRGFRMVTGLRGRRAAGRAVSAAQGAPQHVRSVDA